MELPPPAVDNFERARKYLSRIPDSVEGQQGHNALFRAAAILTNGFAFNESEALELLKEFNVSKCSPPWSDKDLERKVRDAAKKNGRKPRGHLLGSDRRHLAPLRSIPQPPAPVVQAVVASLKDLPELPEAPEVKANPELTITHFLAACFEPGESVQIETPASLTKDMKARPMGKGTVRTSYDWNERVGIDPILDGGPGGSFIRINPVLNEEGKDSSVQHHRHVLLEWDTDSKVEQLERIMRSKLPVSAIVDSGGKSIHAWVKVNAASREEYDARVLIIYDLFKDCPPDKQNKNPSRFTRLPFAHRGDNVQSLINIKCGLKSWDEWTTWKASQDDAVIKAFNLRKDPSTEYFDLEAMMAFDPKDDKTVLIGADRRWICKGYPFQIVGFSGTGKSSLAVHLAVNWALNKAPFGLKPVRPLRILMVQAENDFGDAAEGLKGATAKLIQSEKDTLKENLIFVRQSSKVGFEFIEYLGQMVDKHKIDLIIADPLLAYANFDIAMQEPTSAFLRGPGGVQEMLQRTGAALLYMHHTTKPKSADDLDAMTSQQLAYLGAGCAEWVNFARDSGYLFRTHKNTSDGRAVYRFGFSKRQSRSGLKYQNHQEGDRLPFHLNLCHATGGDVRWEEAPPDMDDLKGNPSPAKGSSGRLVSM